LDPRGAGADDAEVNDQWEAYFFVPGSFRLDDQTYLKSTLYGDLQSYVRLALPSRRMGALVGEPLQRVTRAFEEESPSRALQRARVFACQVRSAAHAVQHAVSLRLADEDYDGAAEVAVRLAKAAAELT